MDHFKRIFGIGTVVVDHVVVLDKLPERDSKGVIVADWQQVGGPVPVALSTAAHYGVPASFAGRWGNDVAGQQIVQVLSNRGIDLGCSESKDDWKTGFAHVWNDEKDGTRTIAAFRGEFPGPALAPAGTNWKDEVRDTGVLHLDGSFGELAIAAASFARDSNTLVTLDAGSKKPGMEELVPLVDVLIASDLFCKSWFGTVAVACEDLHALGCQRVVRTCGAKGAIYSDAEIEIHEPAIDISPVDTNGAGDIFAGAFLFGLLQEWRPARILKFANAVAGFACTHRGNSTWPSATDLSSVGVEYFGTGES